MSSKFEKLLEEMRHELQKKTARTNVKIFTLIKKYRPTASERERSILRNHISPALGELRVAQVDVPAFIESHLDRPVSSAKKILKCFERLMQVHDESFELPKITYRNPGKKWTLDHILTLDQIEDVIRHVYEPYRPLCWVSVYSALRLGNVVGLKKGDVDLKEGWIETIQTKTKKLVAIPISEPLYEVFRGLKRWPLGKDDLLFPGMRSKAVSTSVRRGFHRAGIDWGNFHQFRHFAACYLINQGVELAVVRDILGHSDFRSTLVYARIKRETLKEAMKVFNAK